LTPEQERDLRLQDTRAGFLGNAFLFCRDVLGYKDLRFDPHFEICNFLQNGLGNGSYRWSNRRVLAPGQNRPAVKKHKLVLAPRSSFKSTIGRSEIIRRFCVNPRYRVLLLGYNIEAARDSNAEISGQFLHNESLRALFGDLGKAGRKKLGKGTLRGVWSRDNLQMWDPRTRKLVSPVNMFNLRTGGLDTGVTRLHPELVWLDDGVCKNNTETLDGLDSVRAFIRSLEPLLDPGTEFWVSGTIWDHRDAYQDLIDNSEWDVYCASAVGKGNVLWFPEKLSWEFLKSQERSMGTYLFSGQYLNDPVHPKDAVFQEDWILRATIKREDLPPPGQLTRKGFCDPACTDTRRSDHTGKLFTGMDNKGHMWCLDSAKAKLKDMEILDSLARSCLAWQTWELVVEQVAAQRWLKPLLEQKFKDLSQRLHFIPYDVSTRRSKEFRIRAMSRFFEAGMIHITDDQVELLDQLRRYQARAADEDDLLDCLAMACEICFPSDWHEPITPEQARREWLDKFDRDQEEEDQDFGREFHNVFA
jgi:hypothetical protein